MRKKGEKKQITNEKEFDLARNKPFWVFFMYVYSIKLQQNGKSKYLNACIVMPKVTRSVTLENLIRETIVLVFAMGNADDWFPPLNLPTGSVLNAQNKCQSLLLSFITT